MSHFVFPTLVGSLITAEDDDLSAAMSLTEFLPFLDGNIRIPAFLSIFLLTQIFTAFSDGGQNFMNAIIVALLHPKPPPMIRRLVLKAPDNTVNSTTLITDGMWLEADESKQSQHVDSEVSGVCRVELLRWLNAAPELGQGKEHIIALIGALLLSIIEVKFRAACPSRSSPDFNTEQIGVY